MHALIRAKTYASDLAIWLWKILFQGATFQPVNIGSDVSVSIAELANIVRNVINPKLEVVISKSRNPHTLPQRYVPDISLAKSEFGLQVWISLSEAIRRTYVWAVNQKE